MTNKDKTGNKRQTRLREVRTKWLNENAYGLSVEGLIGALMRGECSLTWKNVPSKAVGEKTRKNNSDKSSLNDTTV